MAARIDVNLWGVINAVQAFTCAMLAQGAPGAIINTGSKQAITSPPGVPAYGTAKAALRATTEQLADRPCRAGTGNGKSVSMS